MRFLRKALRNIKKKQKAESTIILAYFLMLTMIMCMVYNFKFDMIENVNESIITSLEGAGLAAVTLDQMQYEEKNQKCIMFKDKTDESKNVVGDKNNTDISPTVDYRYNEAKIMWSIMNDEGLIENYDMLPYKKSYDAANRISTVVSSNDLNVFTEYKNKVENILLSNIVNKNVTDNDHDVNVGYVLKVEIYDMTVTEQIGKEAYELKLYQSKYFTVNPNTFDVTWSKNKKGHSYSSGLSILQEEFDNVDTKTAAQMGLSNAEWTYKKYQYEKEKARFLVDYEIGKDTNKTRRYMYLDRGRACYYSAEDYYWDESSGKYINAKKKIDELITLYGDASTNPNKVYLTDNLLISNYRNKTKQVTQNIAGSLDRDSVYGTINSNVETVIKITYSTITTDEEKVKYLKIKNYIR